MIADVLIPSPGESVTEVTLAAWLKADGDFVRKDEELFEIESEKATLSVSAVAAGRLDIKLKEGDTVKVGAVAATIDTDAVSAAPAPVKSAEPVKTAAPDAKTPEPEGMPSPAAQKMIAEKGLVASQIKGTGPKGRITKADVLGHRGAAVSVPADIPSAPPPVLEPVKPAVVVSTEPRAIRRHKLSALRVKVAERLVASKNQTAMLTTFNEVDMSAVMEARAKYKELFKDTHHVSLGFMSFFVKAVVEALKAYPQVNASIEGDEVVYHDYIDMGIAVSAPKGLVVPVIRNAESLGYADIESEIARLADRARGNQLTLDEMTGGTFTISNGGVFGSMLSTPILNPPQSGILGMHNIVKRPVAINDQVEIRPMMYLALSYDHRIIDGRESVGFLVRVKQVIEDPMRLLLKV
jgi:2-oxoglutarate dehydrogenase E2 component (dihydrolipoamide succinyltransferase)